MKRAHEPLRLGPAILVLAVVSCSSGEPLDFTSFYHEYRVALCLRDVRCGFIPAYEKDACEASFEEMLALSEPSYTMKDSIQTGRAAFDRSLAQACLDAINDLCSSGKPFSWSYFDPCFSVVTGVVSEGGECQAAWECDSGTWCDQGGADTNGCVGTCRALLPEGAICDPTIDSHCAPSDTCVPATATCTARVGVGNACVSGEWCQQGLVCMGYLAANEYSDPPTDEVQGVCRPLGTQGEACENGWWGGSCSDGLFCDTSKTPVVCSTYLSEGQPCWDLDACGVEMVCKGLVMGSGGEDRGIGTCSRRLDVGGTCEPTADITGCRTDTDCDHATRTCVLLRKERGDACDPAAPGSCRDERLYCDGTTSMCANKVPLSGVCVPAAEPVDGVVVGESPCADGACDATSKTCVRVCGSQD